MTTSEEENLQPEFQRFAQLDSNDGLVCFTITASETTYGTCPNPGGYHPETGLQCAAEITTISATFCSQTAGGGGDASTGQTNTGGNYTGNTNENPQGSSGSGGNGGYNNTGNTTGGVYGNGGLDGTGITTTPIAPTTLTIKQIKQNFLATANLNQQQLDWWNNPENATSVNQIVNYLFENQIHEVEDLSPIDFAKLSINALINNGEVDFEYKIIIDNSLKTNPCLNSIYNQLGKAPAFQNYLKNFDGNFSVANLTLNTSSVLSSSLNAVTSPPNNYMISITFNENNLNRPALSIVRTFIHELIHAETFRKLLECSNLPNLNFNNYSDAQWRSFILNLKDNYPGLYDYYTRYFFNTPSGQAISDEQHQLMAKHYRTIIVQVLKQFDNTQSEATYQALAWEGLKNTVAWNNLSSIEKQNINSIITNFNASNTNCQ
jgi:hypothetical protein